VHHLCTCFNFLQSQWSLTNTPCVSQLHSSNTSSQYVQLSSASPWGTLTLGCLKPNPDSCSAPHDCRTSAFSMSTRERAPTSPASLLLCFKESFSRAPNPVKQENKRKITEAGFSFLSRSSGLLGKHVLLVKWGGSKRFCLLGVF